MGVVCACAFGFELTMDPVAVGDGGAGLGNVKRGGGCVAVGSDGTVGGSGGGSGSTSRIDPGDKLSEGADP